MPNFAAQYSSEYLTAEQARAALLELPAMLQEILGQCTLEVCYGFGTNLHGALLYIPMKVSVDVLPYFLEDSIEQRITIPGASDLLISSPSKELELLFCHESDIHVDGSNEGLMRRFMDCKQLRAIKFYSGEELEKSRPDDQTTAVSDP